MKWLMNIYDPRLPDAKSKFLNHKAIYAPRTEKMWEELLAWINRHTIDKAVSNGATEEQLKNWVGIYE